jgi:hypothetical protein
MVEVKGAVLRDSIKAVKVVRHGDQKYNTIVGQLKGETRTLFEQETILPTSWYSLDAFVEFLEIDIKVTAHGNEQELVKWTEMVVERQLSGIYKVFIRLGTPHFVLNRLAVIHQTYFRGVAIEVSLPSTGKATIKYTGFAKQHRLVGLIIIGFYRKALELSGAKEVTAKFTTSIEDDKGYCELSLSWSGK